MPIPFFICVDLAIGVVAKACQPELQAGI